MKTEIKYRTFEQLLDSVKGDLKKFDVENFISYQELLKVAQKINQDLGLKINPSLSKMLEVYNGKTKLPSDFHVANFALRCGDASIHYNYEYPHHYKTYDLGVLEGQRIVQDFLNSRVVHQYTEISDIEPGVNRFNHRLETRYVVVQTFSPSGLMLSFDINVLNVNEIDIINESEETISNVRVVIMGARMSDGPLCDPDNPESTNCPPQPVFEEMLRPRDNCAQLSCTPTGCGTVAYQEDDKLKKYHSLTILNFVENKSLSVDEIYMNSGQPNNIAIRNGFILTNFDEGNIFLNYQSTMENQEGDLIVMYHPRVDDYYEYALKRRIVENMLANGEQVSHLIQLYDERHREAKIDANNYVRTPDFSEIKKVFYAQRKAMSYKYIDMFKS